MVTPRMWAQSSSVMHDLACAEEKLRSMEPTLGFGGVGWPVCCVGLCQQQVISGGGADGGNCTIWCTKSVLFLVEMDRMPPVVPRSVAFLCFWQLPTYSFVGLSVQPHVQWTPNRGDILARSKAPGGAVITAVLCPKRSAESCEERRLKSKYYYTALVNYSEAGTVICIQSAQQEVCAFFPGRNEAPIVRHSDRLWWRVQVHCHLAQSCCGRTVIFFFVVEWDFDTRVPYLCLDVRYILY